MGFGLEFESIDLLLEVIRQVQALVLLEGKEIPGTLMYLLVNLDADIVQSITAVQKELLTTYGLGKTTKVEIEVIECKEQAEQLGRKFIFARGLSRILKLDELPEAVGPKFSNGNFAKAGPVTDRNQADSVGETHYSKKVYRYVSIKVESFFQNSQTIPNINSLQVCGNSLA